MKKTKVNIWNADHPARKKAIYILEEIADFLGDEDIFDCKDGNTTWYDMEDIIVNILTKKYKK